MEINMTRIPTYCEHCGHIWEGNEIVIGGNASITMRGNRTTCPSCGHLTPMLDGKFKVEDGVLFLENGPQISFDKLNKINVLLTSINPSTQIEDIEEDLTEEEKTFLEKSKNWITENGASTIRTVGDILRTIHLFQSFF